MGALGDFDGHRPISPCSTGQASNWNVPSAGDSSYFLVVARGLELEGSSGRDGAGRERAPSPDACFEQALADCD